MAEYGWNLRQANGRGLNHARERPYGPTQIACRICDHVFMSTQALINHIESHMVEEETARRQNRTNLVPSTQRDFLLNSFQPSNFSLPTAPSRETQPIFENKLPQVQQPERNPFLGTKQVFPPRPTLPPQVPSLARNNLLFSPHLMPFVHQAHRRSTVEELPTDCTKPYLSQLEQPIREIVDFDDGNNNISGFNMDLALKL